MFEWIPLPTSIQGERHSENWVTSPRKQTVSFPFYLRTFAPLTSTLRPFLERDKRISWQRQGCEVQYIACIVYLHLYLEKSRPSPHPRCRKMAFLHAQIPNFSPRTMVGRRITDRYLSEYFKKKSGARRAVFPWASGITCCFFRDGIPLGNCTSFYIRVFHPQ